MRRSTTVAAALLLGTATPAFAAEEGGLLSVNPGLTIWTIVIFLIVLGVLSRFAFPKILAAVEAREAHLARLAEEAEASRVEATAAAEENRRLVEETRAKVQEALAEARAQGEAMRAEVMAEARRDQQELLERARRDIAAEREVALDSVRRDAVELSIRAAEKLVRRSLDAEDNRRLVREFLGQVGEPAARA
jgi:F-type H+-transporting ATPase subunit b